MYFPVEAKTNINETISLSNLDFLFFFILDSTNDQCGYKQHMLTHIHAVDVLNL